MLKKLDERRLSHDKGPAPKPPISLASELSTSSIESHTYTVAATTSVELLPISVDSVTDSSEKSVPKSECFQKRDINDMEKSTDKLKDVSIPDTKIKMTQEIENIYKIKNQNDLNPEFKLNKLHVKAGSSENINSKVGSIQSIPDVLNNKILATDNNENNRNKTVENFRLCKLSNEVNRRPESKVPNSIRPVSMINTIVDVVSNKKVINVDETDRSSSRNRSSSVTNRNRKRPSPPPLDRVLQIQATDKILNEIYRKKETSIYQNKDSVHVVDNDKYGIKDGTKNHKKEPASNIIISSGAFY